MSEKKQNLWVIAGLGGLFLGILGMLCLDEAMTAPPVTSLRRRTGRSSI